MFKLCNYRLKKVTNELTRTEITYSYDQFSNLVSAKGNDILTVFRTFDEVGNVYGTEDKSDRIYGVGSRLEASGIDLKEKRNVFQGGYGKLVTKGVEYFHDEEGNLVKKREANGRIWEYAYYGNGMLQKVVRPDKSEVSFGYDAFGRRIEKCVTGTGSGKVIRFLWDGNVPIHQWEEAIDNKPIKPHQKIEYQAEYVVKLSEKRKQEEKEKAARGEEAPESLITWIFQDDFVPRARITKEGCYSIMTDYLGTPTESYDEEGALVWKRELDINGKVMLPGKDRYGHRMKEIGETGFIPFRFQGQYEDEETGLYYNRFRYYDPELGQYTQQDPIGLAGGMNLYSYVQNSNCQLDILGWEDIVYRALRPEDIVSIEKGLGIIPKDPSAHALPIDHVFHGSEEAYGDQFISFTRDERFAEIWASKNKTGVATVDLDTIHNTKLDLSTAEGRIAHLGDASKAAPKSKLHDANQMARGAKEVLVEGEIPGNKVNYRNNANKFTCRG